MKTKETKIKETKTKESFEQFLKEHRAYRRFDKYLKKRFGGCWNRYLKSLALNPCIYINSSFIWEETPEGTEYWSKLNKKWLKIVCNNK